MNNTADITGSGSSLSFDYVVARFPRSFNRKILLVFLCLILPGTEIGTVK
jgi:hypothetical protein